MWQSTSSADFYSDDPPLSSHHVGYICMGLNPDQQRPPHLGSTLVQVYDSSRLTVYAQQPHRGASVLICTSRANILATVVSPNPRLIGFCLWIPFSVAVSRSSWCTLTSGLTWLSWQSCSSWSVFQTVCISSKVCPRLDVAHANRDQHWQLILRAKEVGEISSLSKSYTCINIWIWLKAVQVQSKLLRYSPYLAIFEMLLSVRELRKKKDSKALFPFLLVLLKFCSCGLTRRNRFKL